MPDLSMLENEIEDLAPIRAAFDKYDVLPRKIKSHHLSCLSKPMSRKLKKTPGPWVFSPALDYA